MAAAVKSNPWDHLPDAPATNSFFDKNDIIDKSNMSTYIQHPITHYDSTPMQYFMYGYGMALVTVFVAVWVFKKLMK